MIKNTLKKFREAAGMTQAELAHRAGVSLAWVRTLEQSGENPSPDTALKLAKAIGVDVDRVFIRIPEPGKDRLSTFMDLYVDEYQGLEQVDKERVIRHVLVMDESMWRIYSHGKTLMCDVLANARAFDAWMRRWKPSK
jgi:putative transcriptional regulator